MRYGGHKLARGFAFLLYRLKLAIVVGVDVGKFAFHGPQNYPGMLHDATRFDTPGASCIVRPLKADKINKYGLKWDPKDYEDPAQIEMNMIRAGGYMEVGGKKCGNGLFYHYKALQLLLWPEGEDHHRWSDLLLEEILNNRVTVVLGARDTGKTHTALSRYAITDYVCFPHETLILMSSTHAQGIQLRVYGDVKDLLSRAKDIRAWLPGNIVESKLGIFTDSLGAGATIRDMRKGIICVPCLGGEGEWLSGLEKFIGVKQKRRRLLGDEVQFMDAAYLNVMANLDKGDFKGVFAGNPLGNGDPLDRLSEPVQGWTAMPEPKKTEVWNNRLGGRTVNLVGTDSPNFDVPEGEPPPYPYLISREDVDRVAVRYGTDSLQYWSQIKGVRKSDLMAHRVLTVDLCRQFGAFDECVWQGGELTKIYALDAAFGGDRAVGGQIEFGREVGGGLVVKVHQPRAITLRISAEATIEEQLSVQCANDCRQLGIPPENFYFDAGMRATLAVNLVKAFNSSSINAINFGGEATDRPVSIDEFVYDEKLKKKRLKRCNEEYSKFVTELWFSVRRVVESRQMRELPEDVAREFEMREFTKVKGDRYELETKQETKKRMGRSPDLADWLSIGIEGARRLGFEIQRLKTIGVPDEEEEDWLTGELAKYRGFMKKSELKYGN